MKYRIINYYVRERLMFSFAGLALCVLGIIASVM